MGIQLSDRMSAVASLVDGRTVADIGCDHAFTTIYLLQNNICDNAIAMDLREGPLSIAREHIAAYRLENRAKVMLSDGFDAISPGMVDCAIIAGMGGMLINDIIARGIGHIYCGTHLVLQPQTHIHKVREYVLSIGYEINEEKMVIDDGKYYTVLRAVPAVGEQRPYTQEELRYGRQLIERRDEVLVKYLLKEKKKYEDILAGFKNTNNEADQRYLRLRQECDIAGGLLARWGIINAE